MSVKGVDKAWISSRREQKKQQESRMDVSERKSRQNAGQSELIVLCQVAGCGSRHAVPFGSPRQSPAIRRSDLLALLFFPCF